MCDFPSYKRNWNYSKQIEIWTQMYMRIDKTFIFPYVNN